MWDFVDGFVWVLEQLDEIWLMDIYLACEVLIFGVDSVWLFDKINYFCKYLVQVEEVFQLVQEWQFKVLFIFGVGDIDLFRNLLKDYFGGKV